ncbi:MAG: response regulator transcription factor [Saprospiraceae bacterium]|nr:response regulator transcription factor [Saprospiraceae bacterium]
MNTETKIRVGIVDDDQLSRAGLISLLNPYNEISFVVEASSGQEIIDILSHTSVDVVLIDIKMNGLNGIETVKRIREKDTKTKIIMLTMFEEPSYVIKSIDVKANGYLLKKSKAEEIYNAINIVRQEEYYRSDFVKDVLSMQIIRKSKNGNLENGQEYIIEFSERELQILNLLKLEMSSAEIGKELSLSKSSINAYRASMMKKTGTHTSTGLIVYCIKHGILN